MKFILYIFFLSLSSLGFTQEPSYFKIGEKELSGVHIYNIYHDHKGDYWIASNNGLYKYNCFEFQQIPLEKAKSSSVFAFKADKNKVLYCHNLTGQIFKIRNDSAFIAFQIPDEEIFRDIQYDFSNDNEMLIISQNVLLVKGPNDFEKIHNKFESSATQFFSFEGELYYLTLFLNRVSVYQVQEGNPVLITEIDREGIELPKAILTAEGLGIYDDIGGEFIGWFDGEKIIAGPKWRGNKQRKGILFSDGEELYITQGTGGMYNSRNIEEVFFENQTISCLYKDNEGNQLAGTFGEGIIVIPNMKVKNLLFGNNQVKPTRVCALNNVLYFGTNNGDLYRIIDDKPEKLSLKGQFQIEFLEATKTGDKLFVNLPQIVLFDPNKTRELDTVGIGSPKGMMEVFPQEYLFSSNEGLEWYDPENRNKHSLNFNFFNEVAHVNGFRERSTAGCYETLNRIFYMGSIGGLKIGTPNNSTYFEIDGDPIVSYDIKMFQGKVYVATKNNGILIFTGGELTDQWNKNSGFISNEVKQISIQDQKLYGTTEKGFFQSDLSGQIQKAITRSDGLNSNNITDFEVIDDVLWLISDNRLQQMPINVIQKSTYRPELNYLNIFYNDVAVNSESEFDSKNNKFNFSFACKSLKFKEDITYSYRLSGLEENWTTVNYSGRNVEYKSLPAGTYNFEVFAESEEHNGKMRSFAFTVLAPFYLRMWFLILVASTFICIVLFIYFVQKARYKRKVAVNQKLAKYQLATLKSQMNPHFLFNSLNSVQSLILQEKKEGAYKYITKFSQLVRKILNQSDADFIDIEDEIKLLNVYLELEQLRFKKDFEYKIDYEGIEEVEIPPMLIQPMVENAIKHGLLHKKGAKKLRVIFEQRESIIICRVIDNGIGRERALEIKHRQLNHNKSFALNSIEKRMELLKEVYSEDLGVTYIDLKEGAEVKGTEVIIKFPFRNKF